MAAKKRSRLDSLYRNDDRVNPWSGTAQGVLQAVNTYENHLGAIRGIGRAERNVQRTVNGDHESLDRMTWATLQEALPVT
jgi:hypothetical protein